MSLNTDPKIATHIAHTYSHEQLLTPALIYIWNADADELEKLADEVLGRLPINSHPSFKELCSLADHSTLRDMEAHIQLLLEAPCKTEECQADCTEHYRKERKNG